MNQIDFDKVASTIDTSEMMGCDTSFANIYLYQNKYNTILEIQNDILLRYNKKSDGMIYFAYPIPLKNANPDYLRITLDYIISHFDKPFFHLITEKQVQNITKCLQLYFPNYSINWKTDRADTDYIYLQSELANLAGNVLQKKKNHINQFMKIYKNRWNFLTFPDNHIENDILEVEQHWYNEKNGHTNPELTTELQLIHNALSNKEMLNLRGAVLYVDKAPVAMTLASPISPTVIDILFEKAIGEYTKNGAYSVINYLFAQNCSDFKFINREEDLGIEGLRKAKLSYKPAILLHKYHGELI